MFKAVSVPTTVGLWEIQPKSEETRLFSIEEIYLSTSACKQRRDNLLRGLWWLSVSSGQLLSPIVFRLCLPQFSQTGSNFIFCRSRLDAFGVLWALVEYKYVARNSVLSQPELLQNPFLQVGPRYRHVAVKVAENSASETTGSRKR